MKVLIVNKFLYPNGGSETYIFGIGKELERLGNEVQYFGMEHEGRIVGNHANSYTSGVDFHVSSLSKITYPFRIKYSREARKKIRAVLEYFNPEVVHLNNINFQLTPSIIDEIRQYNQKIRIVYTAHDFQWICPNHQLRIPDTGELCMRCINGKFGNCISYNCIHNSKMQSVLGAIEGWYYRKRRTYRKVDSIICPSEFMEKVLSKNEELSGRTLLLRNFIPEKTDHKIDNEVISKLPGRYMLFCGRFSAEKGIDTLIAACRKLPEINFVFAGSGDREQEILGLDNAYMPGFLHGGTLEQVIRKAEASICPSIVYENCPFSVMESQIYSTPVIASNIGGIPELVDDSTGILVEPGDADELAEQIRLLWNDPKKIETMKSACAGWSEKSFCSINEYCAKLLKIYEDESTQDMTSHGGNNE